MQHMITTQPVRGQHILWQLTAALPGEGGDIGDLPGKSVHHAKAAQARQFGFIRTKQMPGRHREATGGSSQIVIETRTVGHHVV